MRRPGVGFRDRSSTAFAVEEPKGADRSVHGTEEDGVVCVGEVGCGVDRRPQVDGPGDLHRSGSETEAGDPPLPRTRRDDRHGLGRNRRWAHNGIRMDGAP